jgi:hypothetical protein
MQPLNDRLLYINEDGSRRESVIASVIAARLGKENYESAKSYIEAKVDGELQLYYGRKQIREAGDTTVSDMLAEKAEDHLRKARELHGEGALKHIYNIAVGAPLESEPVDLAPFLQAAE